MDNNSNNNRNNNTHSDPHTVREAMPRDTANPVNKTPACRSCPPATRSTPRKLTEAISADKRGTPRRAALPVLAVLQGELALEHVAPQHAADWLETYIIV